MDPDVARSPAGAAVKRLITSTFTSLTGRLFAFVRDRWRTRSFHPDKPRTEILILADRRGRARGQHWARALADGAIAQPATLRVRSLADDVAAPMSHLTQTTLEAIREAKVVIINWDAANGDPDFGADAAQHWLRHRRSNLLDWVCDGGILIVEGQANLGVPSQEAYDALFGTDEVQVCGPEDPMVPRLQTRRVGVQCQLTRAALTSSLFRSLPEHVGIAGNRSYNDMFASDEAGRLVAPFLREGAWPLLYRGWFRRRPFKRQRLGWVPLVKSKGRRFNHPTLLVARAGAGAIFVSTMLLASSDCFGLIRAMINARGNVEGLPQRQRLTTLIADHKTDVILPLLAALASIPATVLLPVPKEWDRVWDFAVWAVVGILLAALIFSGRRVWSLLREIRGV
jgi:hypothetical protein